MSCRNFAHWLTFPLVLSACAALAQQPGQTASEPQPPAPSAGLVQAKPDTFYLIDASGKLVPYFGMPFEEFEQVYRLYRNLKRPEEGQRFILQELSIDGTANADQADLQLSLRILSRIDGWLRVPLRLDGLVLQPGPIAETDVGDHFLEISADSDGLGCWVRGSREKIHQVRFHAIAKTESIGEKTRIALNCPTATVSQMRLRVPGNAVQAEVNEGPVIREIRAVDDEQSEISILGLGELFELAWQPEPADEPRPAPPLQVNGDILVTLRGQNRVACVADLTVSSPRVPFDTFIVRLPEGMEFRGVDQPNVARPLSDAESQGLTDIEGQLVEIKLASKTNERRQVRIAAREQQTDNASERLIELAGFDVLGAAFQTGSLNVQVEDEWTFQPFEGLNIRRVEGISNQLRAAGVVARFVYDSQPCSLKVEITAKQQRVRIESQYELLVEMDRVDLIAKLNCQLRGAKTDSMRIDMTGWVIDNIDETRLIDPAITQLESVSPLVIHLATSAIPVGGQFRLTVRAHRSLDQPTQQAQTWSLPIPRAVASTLVPATIGIYSSDNVILTPLDEQIRGLRLDSTATLSETDNSGEPDLIYREQVEQLVPIPPEAIAEVQNQIAITQTPLGPPQATLVNQLVSQAIAKTLHAAGDIESPQFVCSYEIRERSISATVSAQVEPIDRSIRVQHSLRFEVQYGQIDYVQLEVPDWATLDDQFSVVMADPLGDGQPLTWQIVPDSEMNTQRASTLQIDLVEERSGAFDLLVTQNLAINLSADESVVQAIPLIVPVGPVPIDVSIERLAIRSNESLRIEPDEEPWMATEVRQNDDPTLRVFDLADLVTDEPPQLRLTAAEVENLGPTVIEQAWVQSVVHREGRQERVAFRVSTSEDQLLVRIPRNVQNLELAVDGYRAAHSAPADAPTDLTIVLPENNGQPTHVLELWYALDGVQIDGTRHQVEVPQIDGARWTKKFYWQLVLPQDEHLLASPRGLTPESQWKWQGFYWTWQANVSQRDLEDRTAASHQAALPSMTNQYVFSSFAPVDRFDYRSASRRSVMLVIASMALAVGLALIYLPRLRHPATLFVFALMLVFVGVVYPEPTLLVAQVASLGLVFVLVGQVLRRTVAEQYARRPLVRGTSRSAVESVSEATEVPYDAVGSTASGGSLVIHVNEPGSH